MLAGEGLADVLGGDLVGGHPVGQQVDPDGAVAPPAQAHLADTVDGQHGAVREAGIPGGGDRVRGVVVVEADRYRQNGNESVIKPLGVVADQVQNVGLLGEKDALETPFNSMTLTRKDLDYFGSPEKGPTDMLTLNPAVRDASSNLYNDVSIRGFNLNGHNMYLNGIQGMLDQQHAADIYIDKATVIAGPNLGIVGTPNRENLGGTILFTSKKAQAEPRPMVEGPQSRF